MLSSASPGTRELIAVGARWWPAGEVRGSILGAGRGEDAVVVEATRGAEAQVCGDVGPRAFSELELDVGGDIVEGGVAASVGWAAG